MDEETRAALGAAWEEGWSQGAQRYWGGMPRNPYTGALNDDDPTWYCPEHGGTGSVEDCMTGHEEERP